MDPNCDGEVVVSSDIRNSHSEPHIKEAGSDDDGTDVEDGSITSGSDVNGNENKSDGGVSKSSRANANSSRRHVLLIVFLLTMVAVLTLGFGLGLGLNSDDNVSKNSSSVSADVSNGNNNTNADGESSLPQVDDINADEEDDEEGNDNKDDQDPPQDFAEDATEWPQLVGVDGDTAAALLEDAYPDRYDIYVLPEDSIVTMDYVIHRIRIFVDDVRVVTRVPRIG